MHISIGKKLIGGFMIMALLVVMAGAIGFMVLGKVSSSADIVAKEKTSERYAVMNAAPSATILWQAVNQSLALSRMATQLDEMVKRFKV